MCITYFKGAGEKMITKNCNKILPLLGMVVGTALSAAAFGLIIIPQGFAAGGVTGLSRVLCRGLSWNLSSLVLVINLALLLAGLIFVNRGFAAKTVLLSVLFPAMLALFSQFPMTSLKGNPALSAVLAALLLGSGTGLILRCGASSGGFDVVAVILNRRFKISVATVINICDCSVILLQAASQPLMQTVYGIAVILMSTTIVNSVMNAEQIRLSFAHRVEAFRMARLQKSNGQLG